MIDLDHAATTPPSRAVLEAVWPYLTRVTGNPSSAHARGRQALAALEDARARAARVLRCRPGEVVFTAGGTEADNLAVAGIATGTAAAQPSRRRVVTTAVEHPAVLETARALAARSPGEGGFELVVVGVDATGTVDLDALSAALTEQVALCSVMHANNEIGTVQPIAEVAALCRAVGAPLHTDAVQSAGHLPIGVDALGVDALSVSAHKLGGLRGAGLLFVRGSAALVEQVHGGGQERGRRSGTVDVASAVGTATALELSEAARGAEAPRLAGLRDALVEGVRAAADDAGVPVLATGHPTRRLPGHASFCFPGVGGETVLAELEEAGIACSSGSACAAGSDDASPVLLATGLDPDTARTAVRFTLGATSTADDVEALLAALPGALRTAARR